LQLFQAKKEMLLSPMMSQTTSWNPDTYSKNARFVSDLGEPLLQSLDPRPAELILDLGCGDGALTEKIASAGSTVIGVDASAALLGAARQRGISVVRMDGQRLGLKPRFDAVFSNAALHWMKQPEGVVDGVSNCLKPGGRFVGEFGGKGNVETIRAALHAALLKRGIDPWTVDPWYYPSPAEYSALLQRFGFTIEAIELIPRPTELPGDILDWLSVFAQPFTRAVADGERRIYLDEVRGELEPLLQKADGVWYADYVRLRFKASR
jgi:trans-aconitate methyltransferase